MSLSGLQLLESMDQLLVKQQVTAFEGNQYKIKNSNGDVVFQASEEYDFCGQCCAGSQRQFNIMISDTQGNQVIHLYRDMVCCEGCCFPSALNVLHVYSPPGNLVGTVEQNFTFLTPEFEIKDPSGNTVLQIEGPVIRSGFGNSDFKVLSRDKSAVVGRISKQWSGLLREAFTMADHFGISFPIDLDVRVKAILIGACFLIDFMYYEHN